MADSNDLNSVSLSKVKINEEDKSSCQVSFRLDLEKGEIHFISSSSHHYNNEPNENEEDCDSWDDWDGQENDDDFLILSAEEEYENSLAWNGCRDQILWKQQKGHHNRHNKNSNFCRGRGKKSDVRRRKAERELARCQELERIREVRNAVRMTTIISSSSSSSSRSGSTPTRNNPHTTFNYFSHHQRSLPRNWSRPAARRRQQHHHRHHQQGQGMLSKEELGVEDDESYRRLVEIANGRDVTPEDFDALLQLDNHNKKKTMDSSTLQKLDIILVEDYLKEQASNNSKPATAAESCQVCLQVFSEMKQKNVELRRLPCGHIFCKTCIDEWLTGSSAKCPQLTCFWAPDNNSSNNKVKNNNSQQQKR